MSKGYQNDTQNEKNRGKMLKNLSSLVVTVNNNVHQYMCDLGTSTVDAKEALVKFLQYIGQIEDEAKAKESDDQPKQDECCSVEQQVVEQAINE